MIASPKRSRSRHRGSFGGGGGENSSGERGRINDMECSNCFAPSITALDIWADGLLDLLPCILLRPISARRTRNPMPITDFGQSNIRHTKTIRELRHRRQPDEIVKLLAGERRHWRRRELFGPGRLVYVEAWFGEKIRRYLYGVCLCGSVLVVRRRHSRRRSRLLPRRTGKLKLTADLSLSAASRR